MSQLKSFDVANEIMRAQKNDHAGSTFARVISKKQFTSASHASSRSLVLTALVPEDVSEAAKEVHL